MEQGPAVTGASGPSAPCTHVTFRVARSAPQADEQASDTSHLRTARDSPQATGAPRLPAEEAANLLPHIQDPQKGPHKEVSPSQMN